MEKFGGGFGSRRREFVAEDEGEDREGGGEIADGVVAVKAAGVGFDEDESADVGTEPGRDVLDGGTDAHEAAAEALFDSGGHDGHGGDEATGHADHEEGGGGDGEWSADAREICQEQG